MNPVEKITEYIGKGVEASLTDDRHLLRQANADFMGAVELVQQQQALSHNPQDGTLDAILNRTINATKAQMAASDKKTVVHPIILTQRRSDVILPVGIDGQCQVESALVDHACNYGNPTLGKFGDLVTVQYNASPSHVSRHLAQVPEAMSVSNISLCPLIMDLPITIEQNNLWEIISNVTEGMMNHHALPIRKADRDKFPEYNVPFNLESPAGDLTVKITSGHGGNTNPMRGKYLYITAPQWREFTGQVDLKAGDQLRMTGPEYRIDKV